MLRECILQIRPRCMTPTFSSAPLRRRPAFATNTGTGDRFTSAADLVRKNFDRGSHSCQGASPSMKTWRRSMEPSSRGTRLRKHCGMEPMRARGHSCLSNPNRQRPQPTPMWPLLWMEERYTSTTPGPSGTCADVSVCLPMLRSECLQVSTYTSLHPNVASAFRPTPIGRTCWSSKRRAPSDGGCLNPPPGGEVLPIPSIEGRGATSCLLRRWTTNLFSTWSCARGMFCTCRPGFRTPPIPRLG